MLRLENLLRARHIALRDRVPQGRERVHALGKHVALRVVEDRLRGLGQFATQGDGHIPCDGRRRRPGDGQQVGEFGQGRFGGHVEACDDAGARQAHAGGVEGVDAPCEACLLSVKHSSIYVGLQSQL